MPIDRSKMRKGGEAIDAAVAENEARRAAGGDFKPFVPSIFWADDGDEEYVLFLNPMEEIPQLEMHPFVDLGDKKPHMTILRTDPILGEAVDPIRRDWDYKPRTSNLAIAVRLDPVLEKDEEGYDKPVGFEVRTRTFDRKIRDDKGELTEDTEEVTVPEIGFVCQSPTNFFNLLRSIDAKEAPLHTTPLKITRNGKKDTSYQITHYDKRIASLDLTDLFEYFDEFTYLGKTKDELVEKVINSETDAQASAEIGNHILDLLIDELGDDENYQKLYDGIDTPAKYGESASKKNSSKSKSSKSREKAERPKRTRRGAAKVAEDATPEAEDTSEAPAEEKTSNASAERNKRMETLRARRSKKSE